MLEIEGSNARADIVVRVVDIFITLNVGYRVKMSKKKGIDFNNLTIIDAKEVPAKARKRTPYHKLLSSIGKGKALVITSEEANLDTIRAGIRRLQKRGEFKHITVTQRTKRDGKRILYIINPNEPVLIV